MVPTRSTSRRAVEMASNAASPFRRRHAVTPVRHPPKRRRLEPSSLGARRRASSGSDEESLPMRNRGGTRVGSRLPAHSRKVALRSPSPHDSPRKRKRSDEDSDTGSWTETDRESPQFIADDDQYLLAMAPAHVLRRLRKTELMRLWKVVGLWPTTEDDDAMEMASREAYLDKSELVNGVLSFRSGDAHLPRSPYRRPHSQASSTLTTPPHSTSEDARTTFDADVDATPRVALRQFHPNREVSTPAGALRKGRTKRKLIRGVGPSPMRNGHEGDASPPRSRRSSVESSQYSTTSDESDAVTARPRPKYRPKGLQRRQHLDQTSAVRATPLVQRLRPRNRGVSNASHTSTEVDADDEDGYDDMFDEVSASSRRSPSSARVTLQRKAKQDALRALQAGEENTSDETLGSPIDTIDEAVPLPASIRGLDIAPLSSRNTKDELQSDTHPIQPKRTRSGHLFGDLQLREAEDNDSMDDDLASEAGEIDFSLKEATLSSLTRLRRDQLVHMCELRNLEVGGTKPQLAKVLLDWDTARPDSPRVVPPIASHVSRPGEVTPVLLREHLHAVDPATPHRSEDEKVSENDLNLDLQELGLEDFSINPEHLQKMEKIGSGGFKDVYVGKLRGRKVAISEFREHLSEMDIRELKLLAEFRHPNIVRFRGICIPEDASQVQCMLVSELCENGDLFDYIRNVPAPPLRRVLNIMLDIARGLEYLHLRVPSVIHRDCKSTNILINRQGVAKVGDFGLARVKHSTRSMVRSLVGTVNWQAPELWHPTPRYDYKVDVFSAALVYWEMLYGWFVEKKYPWEGHNEHYIYDAVGQKHRRPPLGGLRKHWGAEPVNLIERMWHQDPTERPTMTDVVADLEALIVDCK